MEILEKIKAIRQAKRLSQAEVAERLDIATVNYGKLENGKIELTLKRLEQLAEIFGVSVKELMFGEKSESSNDKIEELTKEISQLKNEIGYLKELIGIYRPAFNQLTEMQMALQKDSKGKFIGEKAFGHFENMSDQEILDLVKKSEDDK